MPEPRPPERPDRSAWRRFAAWWVDLPCAVGLLDVWLFRRGGYPATITGATRAALYWYPALGLLFGVAAGILWGHMFVTFDGAARSGYAIALSLLGVPIGLSLALRFLYG